MGSPFWINLSLIFFSFTTILYSNNNLLLIHALCDNKLRSPVNITGSNIDGAPWSIKRIIDGNGKKQLTRWGSPVYTHWAIFTRVKIFFTLNNLRAFVDYVIFCPFHLTFVCCSRNGEQIILNYIWFQIGKARRMRRCSGLFGVRRRELCDWRDDRHEWWHTFSSIDFNCKIFQHTIQVLTDLQFSEDSGNNTKPFFIINFHKSCLIYYLNLKIY